MSLFSKQKTFCNVCGKYLFTDFQNYDGRVCNKKCSEELNYLKTLSILGKEYTPRKGN